MARLTEKQRLFCKFYMEKPNGTEAATKAGYAKDSAHVTASKLLRDAKIIQYMDRLKLSVEQIFIQESRAMLDVLLDIAQDTKAPTASRVRSAVEIIDRGGHKPTDKIRIDQTVTGSVTTRKEVHLIQELVNTNEAVADAVLQAMKNRNRIPNIPTAPLETVEE
jgi:phage terminase small subunit